MNTKILLAMAVIPAVFMAACSDEEILNVEEAPASAEDKIVETAPVEPLAVYLTDQQGNEVTSIDKSFGVYNLHIEGAEAWVIRCSDQFISPLKTKGTGDAIVPVYVSTCWGQERSGVLSVRTLDLDAETRADGEEATTEFSLSQAPAVSAGTIQSRFGSCLGTGYSVNPFRSSDIYMALAQPVFDVQALLSDNTISDNYNFQQTETYYVADSEAKLHEKLDISGGLSFKYGTIAVSGSGSYASQYDKNESSWFCMKANRTRTYQRELNYLDEINRTAGEPRFSNGFKGYSTVLENALSKATTLDEVNNAINNFFDFFGPFFVYRSALGAELDYTCSITKTVIDDSTAFKAAVKLKWEKEVVKKTSDSGSSSDDKGGSGSSTDDSDLDDDDPSTHTGGGSSSGSDDDSDLDDDDPSTHTGGSAAVARFFAANAPAADKNTVDVDGDAEYQKNLQNIANNTQAKLEVKGGKNTVSILANGGTMTAEDFTTWQQSISADNAVMVSYTVAPIYILFKPATKSYKYLKQYSENGGIVSMEK